MMQMTAIAPSPRTTERAQSSVVNPLAPGGVGEVVVGLTMRVLFEVGADVAELRVLSRKTFPVYKSRT